MHFFILKASLIYFFYFYTIQNVEVNLDKRCFVMKLALFKDDNDNINIENYQVQPTILSKALW